MDFGWVNVKHGRIRWGPKDEYGKEIRTFRGRW